MQFLHREVESCPEFHREFIEQGCRSPASFFAVESTVPGRSIGLKDILTAGAFRCSSSVLRVGDLTFTRVVTAAGASIMTMVDDVVLVREGLEWSTLAGGPARATAASARPSAIQERR